MSIIENSHMVACVRLESIAESDTAAQRLYRKFGLEVVSMHLNRLLSDADAA